MIGFIALFLYTRLKAPRMQNQRSGDHTTGCPVSSRNLAPDGPYLNIHRVDKWGGDHAQENPASPMIQPSRSDVGGPESLTSHHGYPQHRDVGGRPRGKGHAELLTREKRAGLWKGKELP